MKMHKILEKKNELMKLIKLNKSGRAKWKVCA